MSLELATTSELINELIRRPTFVGVVVHSEKEHKGRAELHNNYHLHASNLSADQVAIVLGGIVEHLAKK